MKKTMKYSELTSFFVKMALITSFFVKMALNFVPVISCTDQRFQNLHEKIESSMIAATWGDVLGGVTEFHSSPSQLFFYHPSGVLSVDNFTNADWAKFPVWYSEKNSAPYTDDTAMALVVADYCISLGLNGNQDIGLQWSEGLASAFICDMKNPYGWKVSFRAPGISTMNALQLLSSHDKNEWPLLYKKFENHQGCGSVMRVHPCGLLFWNNLETVKRAAIAQSKVTHNSSIANTSCAALSVGVAFLLQATSDRMSSDDHEICKSLIALMSSIANEVDSQFLVSFKINKAYQVGVKMQALLTQYGITTPEQLIEALKNETSDIARYHFEICKKFPGWKADDAVAAAVYSVVATIASPYLAIMLGVHSTGDSDSIASLAGALIGAWHGKQALPEIVWEREVPRIEGIETIKAYAKRICDLSFLMVS